MRARSAERSTPVFALMSKQVIIQHEQTDVLDPSSQVLPSFDSSSNSGYQEGLVQHTIHWYGTLVEFFTFLYDLL